MKVRISDLSQAGLHLKDTLSLEALNARMAEGRENDIIFTAPPEVDVTILPTASGAQLKGTVRSEYRQACSLCLETVQRTVELNSSLVLKERPLDETADQYEDDVGIVYYENDYAELDEVIQEALILSLDIFWHPEFQNKNCAHCKRSKAELGVEEPEPTTSLGDLLKKAGVN